MIDAYDLRIGNRLLKNGKEVIIDGEAIMQIQRSQPADSTYDPIPLTSDVLARAGFVQRGDSAFHDKLPIVGFTYVAATNTIMIYHPGNTLTHFLHTKIHFLHQLQNLFYCIIGQEIAL
jgi:hypothetical protein